MRDGTKAGVAKRSGANDGGGQSEEHPPGKGILGHGNHEPEAASVAERGSLSSPGADWRRASFCPPLKATEPANTCRPSVTMVEALLCDGSMRH
ncbi:hypothetical protein CPLU01_02930 [Colletotrichum plurivorum]|uniref:Uncharacterized protein n=1 Tax=Colletotrichum plurivorum TaxID=2175906 RepID=A0A8H6KTU7_9PEZI|nr:hypothetical protein CPLU01_02930 [Colletotrichum plurivorum]